MEASLGIASALALMSWYTISFMKNYRPITLNRRARHDYAVDDRLLAGISLLGTEVKSAKAGKADLKGAFAGFIKHELWLNNATIPPFQPGQASASYDPQRARKLLLHKSELNKIRSAVQTGKQAVPLSLGLQHGFIKIELGLGKGKRHGDKRETIKRREASRESRRYLHRAH